MPAKRKKLKKAVIILSAFLLLLFIFFAVFVNRYLEPILKDRLHTLIIKGSDSLYTYKLGDLNANFLGGNVEVKNLQINIDSNRYKKMAANDELPSLTFQLNLVSGQIKGVSLLALMFDKEINIKEILSKEADVRLLRHIRKKDVVQKTVPLWKAMQPTIDKIHIGKISLNGVKLLYKNADTSESVKLQFDRCVALFDDVRIDSASYSDTSRIGFTKEITMDFNDLKFRTEDSMYKMKAEYIRYSSSKKTFEIEDFKLQPTLKGDAFYKAIGHQQSKYTILFDKVKFTNFRLDRFFHNNIIQADSALIDNPDFDISNDRTYMPVIESKIGKFPHQQLLKAPSTIIINGIRVNNANLVYTEKNEKTLMEGKFILKDFSIIGSNVTNDSNIIKQNPVCKATLKGKILVGSPITANFIFPLDSVNGSFNVNGSITGVNAAQLNTLAEPMANVKVQSFNVQKLDFNLNGNDYDATGNVNMLYNNLAIELRKTDEETGQISTKKFLTKILNKYTLHPSNPGDDGVVRTSQQVSIYRLSTQSFFGLIWKTIFVGMQNIMMKTGRYE